MVDVHVSDVSSWFLQQARQSRRVYLLLDGATTDNACRMVYELEDSPHVLPLFPFSPPMHEALDVSPLLVEVTEQSPLVSWFLSGDRALHLGYFLASTSALELIAKMLAARLFVRQESGHHALFRCYDPQVVCDCMDIERGSVFSHLMHGIDSVLLHASYREYKPALIICDLLSERAQPQEPLEISFHDMEQLASLSETRIIEEHIVALSGITAPYVKEAETEIVVAYADWKTTVLPYFYHPPIPQTEKDMTNAELTALEKKYDFTTLTQLLTAHTLIKQFPRQVERINAILSDTTIPIEQRIASCQLKLH